MSKSFMDAMSVTMTDSCYNLSRTENGALGFKSTGKKLLDMNFSVASMRKMSDAEVQKRFAEAIADSGVDLAVTWLFMARDIRGNGMGERRLFRVCMRYLSREFPDKAIAVLPLIAEYGRWDDVIESVHGGRAKVYDAAVKMIGSQLQQDAERYKKGESISLLAKWMPSINTSSKATVETAKKLCASLGLTPKNYQRLLSKLRGYLKVVERSMSANQWGDINYEHVPSRSNLLYNSAFLRHDEERRRYYLGKLEKGDAKINAGAVFPHDIVHKYGIGHSSWGERDRPVQPELEAMWKALPEMAADGQNTMVVADGSGSMCQRVDKNSSVQAIEVADALAVYFAERMHGAFRNKYIIFSSRPKMVDLGGASTLLGKLQIVAKNTDCTSTNIESVFDLVLLTAINNNMTQEELPHNVLIISDMEFNSACRANRYETLFTTIRRKFESHGYKMPRLVFWNVASRSGTIPLKENEMGVALVSGFSPAIAKMVMSEKTDPMDALMETLMSERYEPVREALSAAK